MFILNKKTRTVQECQNNDAIKACKKDADNYAVAETREELLNKTVEEPPKVEAGNNSSPNTGKADSGIAEGAQNGKNGEGEGQQVVEGKPETGEGASEPDETALQAMNVETLREMAKSKGIQGYWNMNKETLVAMIQNH